MKVKSLRSTVTALILSQVMIFYSIPIPLLAADPEMRVESSSDLKNIIVPTDYGKIEDQFEGLEEQIIVHIQDVHSNYEAQKNIASIIKQLSSKNDINLLGIEGASGPFMIDQFHVFKNQKVREKVADYFMKTGKFNGAEYLAYSRDLPLTLYGIEDAQTYLKHYAMFREPLKFNKEYTAYYEQAATLINAIKNVIYSDELKEMDAKLMAQENGEITLVDFSNYLKDLLLKHNFILKDYKNFARLVTLDHLEKQIDFDNVNKERTGLINYIGPRLEEEEIQEIREVSLAFSKESITSDDYYKYLKNLADAKEIDISRFPNIAFYFKYLDMFGKLDFTELVKEKDELVRLLKEKLFTTDDQRTVNAVSDSLLLMSKLFALRVSNEEFKKYQAMRENITDKWIKSSLSDIAQKYDIPSSFTAEFTFNDKFEAIDNFYKLAKVRDKQLLDNTLSFMKEEDSNTAVLISGGFHTIGMTEMMKEQDVSYVVVAPTITKEHDYNKYISNMTGQEDTMDTLFSFPVPEASIIPAPVPTAVNALDPSVKEIIINTSILYNLALEIVGIIDEKIDLTDKIKLPPEAQKELLALLGGNEYLLKISETLGVPNVYVDLPGIRTEGGNNAIIVIPIRIYDLSFFVAYRHPEYDKPSKMIEEFDGKKYPKKDIPELNMTLYFEGAVTAEHNLIIQDPFIPLLQQRLIAPGIPQVIPDLYSAVQTAVESNIQPDRIAPKVQESADTQEPAGRILNYTQPGRGDALIMFNVNGTDLMGLSKALADNQFDAFQTIDGLDLSLYTMTRYSEDIDAKAAYPRVTAEQSLGKTLADANVPQSRIASVDSVQAMTEALDGNTKIDYTPEKFAMIEVPVPPAEAVRQTPAYNSGSMADEAIKRITDSKDQLIVAGFSAPDALGQTGDIIAAAEGFDIMDQEIARVVETALKTGVSVVITGTHGNIEKMVDENGTPIQGRYSSFTNNPVPFIYIDGRDQRIVAQKDILRPDASLGSVAPTILDILGIAKPETMTAPSIFRDFEPMKNGRVLLITVDGLGTSAEAQGNAVELARKQVQQKNRELNFDRWMLDYPSTQVSASGTAIGLRENTPGYPAAAYFAMGSGLSANDIVLDMVTIDRAIADNSFNRNEVFLEAITAAQRSNTKLHLLGLVSSAEIDSSIAHLEALLRLAKEKGLARDAVVIHVITDGIDEAPASIAENINAVTELTKELGIGIVATAGGRYWFMNPEQEYDKIEKAYNSLLEEQLDKELDAATGVVLLPEEIVMNSLGLREALAVIRQQYGSRIKLGVLTTKSPAVMQRILQVNNVADKIDFILSEPELGVIDPAIGLIDPIVSAIRSKYPTITDPQREIAIITLDLAKLGPDAISKARVFVQEVPQNENEVFSVANGLFVAVMTIEGHDNELVNYEGWAAGQPGTLRTITVERNFLDQLNRQRKINELFETAA
ncbi:MAG: hypothetical protein AB1454_11280 [Candidatus Auribacterota bacterium]